MNFAEKRLHPRLAIYSAALVVVGAEGHLSEVKDLSQSGARIGRPKTWPAEKTGDCHVFFIFDQETVIRVNAHIVRAATEDIGLEFLPGQEPRIEALLYESRFLDADTL